MIQIEFEKKVRYFGCWDRPGHYFLAPQGKTVEPSWIEGFCWTYGNLDGGLLKNGDHPDVYDGKVFWTCGGNPLWLAFFWWDNSVDTRKGSNSGFYVQGFPYTEPQAAFDYACSIFPKIVARQKQPLILQL